MPRFEPFAGIRYNLDLVDLSVVTSPPYDVIDADDRARLAARHEANVVAVDLPVEGDDPYATAAADFRHWLDEGLLVRDEPCFYGYRMDYVDEAGTPRHTTGVFGALELSRPGEGGILPHERTTPKAKSDRLQLLRATDANLSAVWGLSPAPGLTALVADGAEPLASWSDDEGVGHTVWRITDPARTAAIAAAVGDHPVVIADGHHRYETSLAYRDERRAQTGGDAGGAELVMTLVVELVDHELTVLPIHRLISGLPEDFDLLEALEAAFRITPSAPVDPGIAATMRAQGALVLVEADRTSVLTPRPEVLGGVRDLDTVRLDTALAHLPPHELVYQHGIDHVVSRVAKGEAQAGVLLNPASVAQIVQIAEGGERMPPKTTFFHPKPRTGVVFRDLR
ncbi:MAG: DUF1015 domain-containing protein [Acidimicrobiales bacterium]|nr:DUF1015 domain-containing protein [Acidimicrobiales bacterium]